MKCLILLIVALSLAPFLFGQSQTCDSFNYYPAYTWNNVPSGYVEHSTGDHALQFMDIKGQCIYSSINQKYCAISTQTAMTASGVEEKGALTTLIREHAIAASAQGGAASSNGPQIQSGATGAVAATSCLIVLGCNVTISFSASASGVGVTASFSNTNLGYTYQQPYTVTCGQIPDPVYAGGCTPPSGCNGWNPSTCTCQSICQPPSGGCPPNNTWNPSTCSCVYQGSPIVIDTTGKGFHLTSMADGVKFDISGSGHPIQLGWTDAESGNAWLALDRNHNGVIDNGQELFGNFTKQPPSNEPNGYLALAEFDKPENGCNGDGVIDERDAIFPQLLLWIDANHDGISQPEELHSLPSLGVYSISLLFHEEPLVDKYGNQFRYRGVLNPNPADGTSKDGRYTYDVFLVNGASAGKGSNSASLELKDELK